MEEMAALEPPKPPKKKKEKEKKKKERKGKKRKKKYFEDDDDEEEEDDVEVSCSLSISLSFFLSFFYLSLCAYISHSLSLSLSMITCLPSHDLIIYLHLLKHTRQGTKKKGKARHYGIKEMLIGDGVRVSRAGDVFFRIHMQRVGRL